MQYFTLFYVFALAIFCVQAIAPEKQVLITFPNDIPQAKLDEHRNEITTAGGHIVHEYSLIKGFIVKTTEEALEKVQNWLESADDYKPVIEYDGKVEIQ